MEMVSFEIKEISGLMFKKELGGGVRFFLKGEDYFDMRKGFFDVYVGGRGRSYS